MRESGRANKAETRKKPGGTGSGRESWESAARAFARALTSESKPNTCVYRRQCRPVPCLYLPVESQSEQRTVSQFRGSRSPRAHHTSASPGTVPLPTVSYRTRRDLLI